MHPRLEHIAHVTKTHGKRGELVAEPVRGLPPLISSGMEVAVLPPRLKGPRWYAVSSASGDGSGQLVSLEGVGDIDQADALVGCEVLLRAGDLPDDAYRTMGGLLVGREVCDAAHGHIGHVDSVMHGPAQDVIVVSGPYGEVLLPVVPELVIKASAEGPVVVSPPEGSLGEVTP